MLLYTDIISNDEMFSDAFPVCVSISHIRPLPGCLVLTYEWEFRKSIDGIVYEVDCSLITVKAGADVDIGTVDPINGYRGSPLILDRCQPLCRGARRCS